VTVYRRPDPIPRHRAAPAPAHLLRPARTEPEDLHRLISRQLFAAIVSGRYPEGSILPNELSLSEELGVSRTALRESVKGLAAKGLLETRRRRGTQVLSRSSWNLLDPELIGWLRKDDPHGVSKQLWAAVEAVLPTLVMLAARRHSIAGLRSVASRTHDRRAQAAAAFLIELANAAGNRFLLSLVSTAVLNLLSDDPAVLEREAVWCGPDAGELVELIAGGDGRRAAAWLTERLSAAVA
jgi:DNA-binding FadR family transcriptional regulator